MSLNGLTIFYVAACENDAYILFDLSGDLDIFIKNSVLCSKMRCPDES